MIFRRALHDTFKGQFTAFYFLVVGGLLGLVYLYAKEGQKLALDEFIFYESAVIGALAALALLFLWNLAAAPYRIQKERADRLESLCALDADAIATSERSQTVIQHLKSTEYFTVPPGVYQLEVTVSGAGGGGGTPVLPGVDGSTTSFDDRVEVTGGKGGGARRAEPGHGKGGDMNREGGGSRGGRSDPGCYDGGDGGFSLCVISTRPGEQFTCVIGAGGLGANGAEAGQDGYIMLRY